MYQSVSLLRNPRHDPMRPHPHVLLALGPSYVPWGAHGHAVDSGSCACANGPRPLQSSGSHKVLRRLFRLET